MRKMRTRTLAMALAITMLAGNPLYAEASELDTVEDTTLEVVEEVVEVEAEAEAEVEEVAEEEPSVLGGLLKEEEIPTETTEVATTETTEVVEEVSETTEAIEETTLETTETIETEEFVEETIEETTETIEVVETVVEVVAEATTEETTAVEETTEVAEVETEEVAVIEVAIEEEDEVLGWIDFSDVIPVDEAHFPDENFRRYVSENFDILNGFSDHNGKVSKEGWLSYDELACAAFIDNTSTDSYLSEIRSLKGIELFENLEYFTLEGAEYLTGELDLTGFENLRHFEYEWTSGKGLTSVKLPDSVEHIGIGGSGITSINIPSGVKYMDVRLSAYAIANPNMTIPARIETFYGWEFLPMRDYTKYQSLTDMCLGTLEQAKNGRMYGDTGVAEIYVRPQRFLDLAKHGFDVNRVVSCSTGSIENGILYPKVMGDGSYGEGGEFVYDFGINSENRYGLIKIWFNDNVNGYSEPYFYCINNTADKIPSGNTSMDPTNPDNLFEYRGETPTPTPTPTPDPNPTPTPSNPGNTDWAFTDVAYKPGNWKYEAVKYITENGIMKGTSATEFAPDAPLTRGMFATMLYRMAGEPSVAYTGKYPDVPAGKWYSNAIIWASEEGIVGGYANGSFGTNDYITREQIAKMLMEFGKSQGYNVSERANFSTFADAGVVSGWAKEYMQWAVGSGMIGGSVKDGKSYLNPKGNATRAESATMLMRFMEKY